MISARGGLLAVAALGLNLGCEQNAVTFFITQMNAPQIAGTTCTVPDDPNSARIAEGIMDVGLRDDYFVSPLLQNSLVATASPSFGRVETANIIVQGFVVELHDGSPEGALIERPFSVYQSTLVPVGVGGLPSYQVSTLQVIPPPVGQRLRTEVCVIDTQGVTENCPVPRIRQRVKRIIVRLSAFGATQGHLDVETPTFDFPVNVCCGCTVQFPSDSDQAEMLRPGPDCSSGLAVASQGACNPGMDFPLDCRFCASANPQFCQPRGYRALTTVTGTTIMTSPCPTDR